MTNEATNLKALDAYLDFHIEQFLCVADSLPLASVEYWAAVDSAENLRITQEQLGRRTRSWEQISVARNISN